MRAHGEETLRQLVEGQVLELGALGGEPFEGYRLGENPQAIENEEGAHYVIDDH